MKKLILFSLIMVVAVFAFAQKRGGDPATRVQKKVDLLTEQLSLTADQQTQVKNLLEQQHKNRKVDGKKRGDMTDAERDAMKAERKAAKTEFDARMSNILNAEQNETYKNMPKRDRKKGTFKGKGKHKGKGKKGANKKSSAERTQHKVAKLTEQLDLSTTQQKQMTALLSSRKEAGKKDKKNWKELSDAERDAYKAERKADRTAFNKDFEKILTPEQLITHKKLKAERKEKGKKKGKVKQRSLKE